VDGVLPDVVSPEEAVLPEDGESSLFPHAPSITSKISDAVNKEIIFLDFADNKDDTP